MYNSWCLNELSSYGNYEVKRILVINYFSIFLHKVLKLNTRFLMKGKKWKNNSNGPKHVLTITSTCRSVAGALSKWHLLQSEKFPSNMSPSVNTLLILPFPFYHIHPVGTINVCIEFYRDLSLKGKKDRSSMWQIDSCACVCLRNIFLRAHNAWMNQTQSPYG